METINVVTDVFKDTVIKYIEDNNTKNLFSIINDPEINPILKSIFPPSWPDFMQPYVEGLEDEIKALGSTVKARAYIKIYDKFNDYCAICLELGLLSSYGYLMGRVSELLGNLNVVL